MLIQAASLMIVSTLPRAWLFLPSSAAREEDNAHCNIVARVVDMVSTRG